jgi:hypothetical protein
VPDRTGQGALERGAGSGGNSYCNDAEAAIAIRVCAQMLGGGGVDGRQLSIGLITPYQVPRRASFTIGVRAVVGVLILRPIGPIAPDQGQVDLLKQHAAQARRGLGRILASERERGAEYVSESGMKWVSGGANDNAAEPYPGRRGSR